MKVVERPVDEATKDKAASSDERAERNAQEVGFRPLRNKEPQSTEVSRLLWKNVLDTFEKGQQRAGEDAWDLGHATNRAYAAWVEVAFGYPSFEAFLSENFPLGATAAYDRMRLATCTDRESAGRYGLARALLGLQLLPYFELDSLAALEKQDLPVVNPRTGRPARFPATTRLLRSAIAQLQRAARKAEEEALPERTRSRVARLSHAIAKQLVRFPELAPLQPRVYVRGDEIRFRMAPAPFDRLDQVAELIAALRRTR